MRNTKTTKRRSNCAPETTIDPKAILKRIRVACGIIVPDDQKPPEGFHPASYWMKKWNLSKPTAYQYLHAAVRHKILETRRFDAIKTGGRPSHYWKAVR